MTSFQADIQTLVTKLSSSLPKEIIERLITEYIEIKHQFVLNKHRPSELSGGHFAETMVRLLEHMRQGTYTPFGTTIRAPNILGPFMNDTAMPASFRQFVTALLPVMMDVRNRRGVAHPGGDINPNYADSVFVVHCADWLMTEVVRHFYACSIQEATRLVASINQAKVPVVFDYNGIVRILDTKLDFKKKTLLTLYYKRPEEVTDAQLMTWLRYSSLAAYRKNILIPLDKEALILRTGDRSILTTTGIKHVEKNIELNIEV
ncbi:hypothetical protein [Deinococcus aestuarii]|uniref:hypothetical protein n=1 Tax=Deinococcus aestuarii TaxID=2774531 RepID=UPI001C0C864A|nr:hypothetical protein [Deinococcus aestuarii]